MTTQINHTGANHAEPDIPDMQNLEAAFAGESMAHIKYLWFAASAARPATKQPPGCSRTRRAEMLHAFGHAECCSPTRR